MLETINGIDLLIALVGLAIAWFAYERGRATGESTGYVSGWSAAVQTMVSHVRVVKPEVYDHQRDGM